MTVPVALLTIKLPAPSGHRYSTDASIEIPFTDGKVARIQYINEGSGVEITIEASLDMWARIANALPMPTFPIVLRDEVVDIIQECIDAWMDPSTAAERARDLLAERGLLAS